MLDRPNERTSHTAPTPRGGGIAIAGLVSGSAALSLVRLAGSPPWGYGLVAGGVAVAVVGWLDDHGHVPAPVRGLVHALAAIGLTLALQGGGALSGFGADLPAALSVTLVPIALVWVVNLYNFMDGADGVASVEAVMVGLWFLLTAALFDIDLDPRLAVIIAAVIGSTSSFLVFNWPPASIFMGDVGSGFLGFMLGGVAVVSAGSDFPLSAWVIVGGVFWVDATLTLLRRMYRGEAWYRPHREHAYQRALRAGYSPRAVVTAIAVLNLALSGLAFATVAHPNLAVYIATAAVVCLVLLYGYVEKLEPMAEQRPA